MTEKTRKQGWHLRSAKRMHVLPLEQKAPLSKIHSVIVGWQADRANKDSGSQT